MQTQTKSAFEQSARERKARLLSVEIDAALSANGTDPLSGLALQTVAAMDDRAWTIAAARAHVGPPSDPAERHMGVSSATRAVVLDLYRRRVEAVSGACAAEIEKAGCAPSVMDLAARASACGCVDPDRRGHVHGCRTSPYIPAPTIGGAR